MNIYVDAHCHFHEFESKDMLRFCNSKEFIIVAVSDDFNSSVKTLNISSVCKNVIPAIGVHPWTVNEKGEKVVEDVKNLKKLLNQLKTNVKILGEVGLDRIFVPKSIKKQIEVFTSFLELARELDLGLSVHAAGAWREVLQLLSKYDIKVAIFHWYSGPLDLLNEIKALNYYISINPAIIIQEKVQKVVEKADLEILLTESDAPYNYRNLKLMPTLIPLCIEAISRIKGVKFEEVNEVIHGNFRRFIKSINLNINYWYVTK